MKETHAYLRLLQDPIVLYFDYLNNVPAPDSDKLVEHYHILTRFILGTRSVRLSEYFKLLDEYSNKAVYALSDFYYEKIRSPDILQAVFNDLNQQLSDISERYRSIDIQGRKIKYSTRIALHVEEAKDKCKWTNESFPYYAGLDISVLTAKKHWQIINTVNDITEKESSSIESIKQVLKKYDKEPEKEVVYESLPIDVLKRVFENFADYLKYEKEDEFVQAVTSLEKILYKKTFYNHIAYLFYKLLTIYDIDGRSRVLYKLFQVYNRSRSDLSKKPILDKIDAFLKTLDENIELE